MQVRRRTRRIVALGVAAAALAGPAVGTAGAGGTYGGGGPAGPGGGVFDRIASFPVYENNDDPGAETVAEIVAATRDGRTLVYVDSVGEQVGFVDITDPADPQPGGTLGFGAEPTSVAVRGGHALVAVDADAPYLAVVDIAARAVVVQIPLAGQPDSVDVSPDGRYAAVAIENERDEEVVVGGVEGGLPQPPAGLLQVVDLVGAPSAWTVRDVALTGLAGYAPEDPEPEYVDVNAWNLAVVTLQENNHVVVVDLRRGRVVSHFPAGTVDLDRVDVVEDDRISLTGSLDDVPREPDGVVWLDPWHVATANEGDLFGGSRGFTVFRIDGRVVHDSGNTLEHLAVRHGHYPESRSENKGTEPEGVAHARYGGSEYLFVGSERGNFVAVYRLDGLRPRFVQLLPTGIGPEGLLPIPARGLFVATSEVDDPPTGVRTVISLYRLRGGAAYPTVVSGDAGDGTPIPWGALSGLAEVPGRRNTLLAVADSYYVADPRLYTLDVGTTPARIVRSLPITGGTGGYDLEGVAAAPDGTVWVASEGNASDSRPNRLLQLDASGAVLAEVGLPPEVIACRAATTARGSLGAGFEGVTVVPGDGGYRLLVAQQRGWNYTTPGCEALDDDPADVDASEPGWTRLWVYDPAGGTWSHLPYELEPRPPLASWVGLSEVTLAPDGDLVLIERDNRTGAFATLKRLVKTDLDAEVRRADKTFADLLPALEATRGWFTDKPEGFALTGGRAYVVTDNDGVEDASGETQLLRLGPWRRLFPGA
ncbi:MAG: hypothetical protein KatS3mg009_1225 [Acidimicrobiia bacterium]|nr:MAG: hypothetical protein KatS3mg009_1225 [Acidimicrobiia bacterium]